MDTEAIATVAAGALGHSMLRCEDTGNTVRLTVGSTTFEVVYSGAVTRDQSTVEGIIASLCASVDAASATARQESLIAEIAAFMTLAHEGIPHGVPSGYEWYSQPRLARADVPDDMTAAIPWGQIYVDDTAETTAPNTRVELGPIEISVLSVADSKWYTKRWNTITGAWYPEDFQGDPIDADERTESNGNTSVTAGDGYTYHFFPPARIAIDADDVGGVIVTLWARLIVSDSSLPDDRSDARYLVSAGGDWWVSTTAPYVDPAGTNNPGMGTGRMVYATNDWQAFRFSTLTEEELRANPPT